MTFVHCEECGELASVYQVTIPNPDDIDICKECGHNKNPISKTFHFCSWLCLTKWVNKKSENEVSQGEC